MLLFVLGCGGDPGAPLSAASPKESTGEHCDGEDNDGDGSVDEDCGECDWLVTRSRTWWRDASCVIDGDATGTALYPVTVGGTITYSTTTSITNYLRLNAATDQRRRLGQQLVVGRLNEAAFYIGELTWHDVDGDGTDETVTELLDYADTVYTSGTDTELAATATLLTQLSSDGQALGLWFDETCAAAPEVCNDVDDDGDGTVDESCSCQGAPPAPGVTLTEVGDGLLCSVSPVDGTLSYTVSWTVDGAAYADATTTTLEGDTISAAEAARGTTWTCSVTADDGAATSEGSASHTYTGPAPNQYAFELVMGDLTYPSDMNALSDGTLLISDFLGAIHHVDPATGTEVASAEVLTSDQELRSFAIHPDFGDGAHDWIYVWASQDRDLYRFDLTLDPFTITNGTVVLDADADATAARDSPLFTAGSGGALLFWSGETGVTTLYLGVGPTSGGNSQEEDNLGQKLLALTVDDTTGDLDGGAVDGGYSDDRIAALGLRNPWRATDCGAALCVADPGNNSYEEVDLYTGAGNNFGYPREEGPGAATYDDPSVWWENSDTTYGAEDLDGDANDGFSNVPWTGERMSGAGYGGRLDGWVLFGDFYDGWIRAMHVDDTGALTGDTVPVAHQNYVLKAVEVDGTLYVIELGGTLQKLILRADRAVVGQPGAALSATDWSTGTAFDVRYALWSNGADKERVIVLPSGELIDTSGDDWVYPDGTRIYKTFSVDGTNVETRVIEKSGGRWIPGVYKWDGADAYLTEGFREDVTLASGDTYTIPSTVLCAECHESDRGREWPLGLEPFVLGDAGLRDVRSLLSAATGPAPMASGTANTRRVRGYLHSNCSFCHSPTGITSQMSVLELDFTYDATIDTTLIANYYNANPNAGDGDPIFDPSSPTDSVIYQVMADAEMPPVSVWEADTSILTPLSNWIAGL